MGFLFQRRSVVRNRETVHADVPELKDAEISAAYYGERLGGDLYDFTRVSPDRVLFGMLDVAGRLEQNRDIVAAAQQTFRQRGLALFASEEVNEANAMIELCLELNRTVLQAEGGVRSCPAFAGCYNESLGTICYFNAGHTPGLIADGSGVSELPATGLPLGLFSHATCDAPMTMLQPGAALLLVSRGVVEGRCQGDEYGMTRLKQLLEQDGNADAKRLCSSVLDSVQRYMCAPPVHNDVTALALVRRSALSSAISQN